MDKTAIRCSLNERAGRLSPQYVLQSDEAIFRSVTTLPEYINAKNIFLYYSVGYEVDTGRIAAHALSAGKTVAFPVVTGSGEMDFYSSCGVGLKFGAYGIPEPDCVNGPMFPEETDVIIVPGLSFDESGLRIGHGCGFYDRFLAGQTAFTIGLCRDRMVSEQLPCETHDIRVRCLITETKEMRLPREPQV